jgi:multiple sugar transport system substrate-binding protein
MSKKNFLVVGLVLMVLLAACGTTPAPQTIIQTVEVEKTVQTTVEKTVIQTVEVEKKVEVPVKETVIVTEKPLQLSFAGHQYFNLSFGPAPAPMEFMRTAAAEVYPNIDIQLIMQPLDGNKWHDNLTTYFVAEDKTVDLLYVAGYWIPEFGKAGWLTPLDDLISPELLAKYGDSYKQVFSYDGKLLGLGPAWGGIGGLYYRKDLLDAAGLQPPETYDDIIAACDAILPNNPGIGCWDWPAMRNLVLVNRWSEYLYGFGGKYFNDDGTCAMNSPEAVKALEFMTMLFKEGYTPQEALSWKEEDSQVRYLSGQTLFFSGRQDLLFNIDDPTKSQVVGKWGFIANPAQPGGRFWAFAISKFSDNPVEAAKLIETWGSLPTMKLFNLAWGPLQGHEDVYTDPDVLANNKNLPLIEEVGKSALAPLPSSNYGEVVDLLQAELHSALSGLATPVDALNNACQQIDAIQAGE